MFAEDVELGMRWVRQRDAHAFQLVVSRYAGVVYGACRRILANATEAEDVTQECFETLACLDTWPQTPLGAWLHRVAVNRSLNRLKSERSRRAREERYSREALGQVEVCWGDVYPHIDKAVADLPDKYRVPLIACFFEGHSHATIASNLALPRRTVTHRIGKGIEQLRTRLKKQGIPVASGILPCLLEANLVEAAPAGLTASLGRIALAGVKAPTSGAVQAPLKSKWFMKGETVIMKKIGLSVGLILMIALGGLAVKGRINPERTSQMLASTHAHIDQKVTTNPAPATSHEQAVAVVESAVVKSLVAEDLPASPDAAALVSGKVIDDEGYPMPDVSIRLEIVADTMGFEIIEVRETLTDTEGNYLIDGVPRSGQAKVYASHAGYLQAISSELPLKFGDDYKGIDLVLEKARSSISGWVVDQDQRPIEGAEVSLRHFKMRFPFRGSFFSGAAKLRSTFSDAHGWFSIGLPDSPADCDFTVTRPGFGAAFYPSVPSDTDDNLFVLEPGGVISGKVMRKDGTPVQGAVIRAEGKAPLGGEPEDVMPAQVRPPTVVTNPDGRYQIENLGSDYVYTVTLDETPDGTLAAAPKPGVEVASGRTTSAIDFTALSLGTIRIHGTATDSATGLPAYPIRVKASAMNPDDSFAGDTEALVNTGADGAYDLSLQVTQAVDLKVQWSYCDGANVYPKNNCTGKVPAATPGETGVEVSTFSKLKPGHDEALDFTVEAPITVPVRFVDPVGAPMSGIEVGIRQGGQRWGSDTLSGNDGRAVHRGLGPETKFVIEAIVNVPQRMKVGESEPFTGTPGETLEELTVVCTAKGGVQGIVVDKDGIPVANTDIGCTAVLEDGTVMEPATALTNEDGSFVILYGLPANTYRVLALGYARDGQVECGILEHVTISGEQILDVGTIQCEARMTLEEAMEAAREYEATKAEE